MGRIAPGVEVRLLPARDFITVGLLVSRFALKENTGNGEKLIRDNWIYAQEPELLVGRLQMINNWSPSMVADPNTVWLWLEYFCNEENSLWASSDADRYGWAARNYTGSGSIPPACWMAPCFEWKNLSCFFGELRPIWQIRG